MARNERAQWARLDIEGVALLADLAAGISLARAIEFASPSLQAFGAAAAHSEPLVTSAFTGCVEQGGSCNCSVITLTPHANGTHTECAGHLTLEPMAAYRVIPVRLLPAVLLSVRPVRAAGSSESSTPPAAPEDPLITRATLEQAWPRAPSERLMPRAAIIRSLPNGRDKFAAAPTLPSPPAPSPRVAAPYLSSQAATALVERGISHLVVDLPSIDRADDGGALNAHRIFFGLPPGSRALGEAQRPECTITELAYVEDAIDDGWYLLSLQAPAIAGDAVPSRPLLYPLRLA